MLGMTVIDTTAVEWEARYNEHLGKTLYRKELMADPDTGMEVRLVRYVAGVSNTWHTHPCVHGMYVLEGTLVNSCTRASRWARSAISRSIGQSCDFAARMVATAGHRYWT